MSQIGMWGVSKSSSDEIRKERNNFLVTAFFGVMIHLVGFRLLFSLQEMGRPEDWHFLCVFCLWKLFSNLTSKGVRFVFLFS